MRSYNFAIKPGVETQILLPEQFSGDVGSVNLYTGTARGGEGVLVPGVASISSGRVSLTISAENSSKVSGSYLIKTSTGRILYRGSISTVSNPFTSRSGGVTHIVHEGLEGLTHHYTTGPLPPASSVPNTIYTVLPGGN